MVWTRLAVLSAFLILVAACGGKDPARMNPGGGGGVSATAGSGGIGGTAGRGGAGNGVSAGTNGAAGDGVAGDGAGSGGLGEFDAGTDPGRNNVVPGTICARLSEIQCAGE